MPLLSQIFNCDPLVFLLTFTTRFLDLPTVTASLGEFVSPEEVVELLNRKDAILHYFDAMVHKKGYGAVVLE
jgi:hypothetical protein